MIRRTRLLAVEVTIGIPKIGIPILIEILAPVLVLLCGTLPVLSSDPSRGDPRKFVRVLHRPSRVGTSVAASSIVSPRVVSWGKLPRSSVEGSRGA